MSRWCISHGLYIIRCYIFLWYLRRCFKCILIDQHWPLRNQNNPQLSIIFGIVWFCYQEQNKLNQDNKTFSYITHGIFYSTPGEFRMFDNNEKIYSSCEQMPHRIWKRLKTLKFSWLYDCNKQLFTNSMG